MIKSRKFYDKSKWLVLILIGIYYLSIFLPVYQHLYIYDSGKAEVLHTYYWYTWYTFFEFETTALSLSDLSFAFLFIPLFATVLLFINTKNNDNVKLFFFTLMGVFIIKAICMLLGINESISRINNGYGDDYCLAFGYYVMVAVVALLLFTVVYMLACYMKNKKKNNDEEVDDTQKAEINLLKHRMLLLNEMKENGILTEEEYMMKRAELVKNLKI